MRPFTSVLFLASALLTAAIPVPISFNDVERRWAAGHSEQQIHSGLSHRDMTPAWPIARSPSEAGGDAFSAATDERTMIVRDIIKKRGRSTLVWDFVAGKLGMRKREMAEVPVLRPRKEMRYYFTS